MKKNKDTINFKYILIAIICLILYFIPNQKNINVNNLVFKVIIVSYDITDISGSKSEIKYRISDKENTCSFVVDRVGAIAAKWKNLDNIVKNDTLQIQIHKNSLKKLNTTADITIYTLIKNKQLIFDLDGYNKELNVYEKKWDTTYIIGFVLFIFRGFTIISSNVAYILVALTVIIFLILNHFEKW